MSLKRRAKCGKVSTMSATIVGAKGQTTLPKDVRDAAGIRVWDHVDWRFQDGEIRGRKLRASSARPRKVRPVKFKDLLILPQSLDVDFDQVAKDLASERDERDERFLG
jgi:bifunctional DNA-binding transcriptional regulator/antitoxin component of YhaV-PrlF toxin-antitoxin module